MTDDSRTEETLQLQVAIFEDEEATSMALDDLKRAQKSHIIAVRAMASVWHDEEGELQIKESADPGGRSGALAGGLIGAIIGLLGGPGGAMVAGAAGALVGGVTATIIDSGIPDQNLELIGQSLLPGDSALVLVVDEQWQAKTKRILASAGARVLTGSLTAVIAQQLQLPPEQSANAAGDGPDNG